MTHRILVTGAAGFVGHHVVEHLLQSTDSDVVGTYTHLHRGDPGRLAHLSGNPRLNLVRLDCAAPWGSLGDSLGHFDYVLNIASDSHVDRSITDPVPFVRNNVDLALHTLEWARSSRPDVFVQFSTDEVYGPARADERHGEWSPIVPSNPYSASKAAQEAIAVSWWRTYGVPVVITNTMNVIGERQDAEKFVPMVLKRIMNDETVTIHADSEGRPGSRFYIHARNVADALDHILTSTDVLAYAEGHADRPARWNIVGDQEIDNLTLASMIADVVGKPLRYELADFHAARPGHDRRYALDGSALAEAGWKAPVAFAESLERTIAWTLRNPGWLNR